MSLELAALVAVTCFGSGLLAFLAGFVRLPVLAGKPERWADLTRGWRRLKPRTHLLLIIGVVLGLVLALTTGWVIALIIVPAGLIGIPWLLGAGPEAAQIARLKAMEEWTRNLAGVLVAGMSLEQAIQVSLKSANNQLRPEISRLVGRLNARMPTTLALTAFAEDLDDPTGDLIVASLRIGASRRGAGLAVVLQDLAAAVSAEGRARQRIDADRASHRTTARGVTIITLVMVAALGFSGTYIAPYQTAIGQIILITVLGLYVAVLVMLKQMGRTPRPPRFLHQTADQS